MNFVPAAMAQNLPMIHGTRQPSGEQQFHQLLVKAALDESGRISPEKLADLLPLLCDPDLEKVRKAIQKDTATPAPETGESSSG